MSGTDRKNLSLQKRSTAILSDNPPIRYYIAMKIAYMAIGKTTDDDEVTCSSFDPSTACTVAPNHSLIGVMRYIIEDFFYALPSTFFDRGSYLS